MQSEELVSILDDKLNIWVFLHLHVLLEPQEDFFTKKKLHLKVA